MFSFKTKGFTMLEFMTAMIIIASLVFFAIGGLSGETAVANNSKRKSDLSTYSNLLALMNSKNHIIPFQDNVVTFDVSHSLHSLRGAFFVYLDKGFL